MSTPLVATAKIRWGWLIDSQLHFASAYCRGLQLQGNAYYINSRTNDQNDTLWSDAAQGLANSIAHVLGSGTVGGVARLYELVNGVWIIRDAVTCAITASANAYQKASELTMTLQTTAFKKVHVVVLEGEELPQTKVTTPTGGGPAMDLFTAEYGSGHVGDHAPYMWQVGRDENYLAVNPFVSITISLNRKVRRARGMA